MTEHKFDFESGDLSLDFANTSNWHASSNPTEYLNNYADLLAWGVQAGILSSESANQLRRQLAAQPEKAASIHSKAIQLREAIYQVFSKRYAGKPVPEQDLALLNDYIREAMAHLQLEPKNGELHWDWVPEADGVEITLWTVARAAAELLTSDKAARVRECEDDRGCGYLFIDQSKNHSRRWCSMESCGNRAKARRHYQRAH